MIDDLPQPDFIDEKDHEALAIYWRKYASDVAAKLSDVRVDSGELIQALRRTAAFYDALGREHADGEAKLLDDLSALISRAIGGSNG